MKKISNPHDISHSLEFDDIMAILIVIQLVCLTGVSFRIKLFMRLVGHIAASAWCPSRWVILLTLAILLAYLVVTMELTDDSMLMMTTVMALTFGSTGVGKYILQMEMLQQQIQAIQAALNAININGGPRRARARRAGA